MFDHKWQQIGTCLNGPHAWQCKICKEWTRAFNQPKADLQYGVDPDDGERYVINDQRCWTPDLIPGTSDIWPTYKPSGTGDERLEFGKIASEIYHKYPLLTVGRIGEVYCKRPAWVHESMMIYERLDHALFGKIPSTHLYYMCRVPKLEQVDWVDRANDLDYLAFARAVREWYTGK